MTADEILNMDDTCEMLDDCHWKDDVKKAFKQMMLEKMPVTYSKNEVYANGFNDALEQIRKALDELFEKKS